MLKVVESLHLVVNTFYNADYFLTPTELDCVNTNLTRMGQNYQALQVLEMEDGRCGWKTTTKMHYVAGHLGAHAELINPRVAQGYRNESLVGEVCTVYKHSQSGPFKKRIQKVALLKYRAGVSLSRA